jgi:drug/metabolite transporter (DMT)-like permease|tara:strand:+ start:1659 stop:2531 length:873 start_codon:yes stop_codon:yes gene_type:complete
MNKLQRTYWIGGAFTLIGAFFFSLQDALVKWLSSDYALLQLLLVRSSIMVPTFALICLARWGRQGLVTRRPGAHLLRAAFNLIAFLSYYYAISRMPLVDALSIASAYPLILTLLSGLVLAEVPNARQIMAILAGFVGVLFIIQPTGNEVDWIGASAALFGCLSFAALAVYTRHLSKTESSELMLLTGAGCILILSLLSAPFIWSQPSFDDLILMLGLSVAALFGQYALTNGFRYAPVYLVGALEYTALVWAAIWGYLLFHDVPTVVVMIGAAIVVSSGLAVVLSERNKPG